MISALILYVCSYHNITVTAVDLYGRDVKYRASYWTCGGGAKPSDPRAMPVCYQDGNAYNPLVYSLPWYAADVQWICGKE